MMRLIAKSRRSVSISNVFLRLIPLSPSLSLPTKGEGSNSRAGFTLIELIMTIIVVGIVALPLSLLISQHIESVFQSADYTQALNLARYEMEKVNNLSYASIVSATSANYDGYAFDVTRTVTYAQGSVVSAESLKQIQVDVTKSGSAAVLASLTTYVAKNISYGL